MISTYDSLKGYISAYLYGDSRIKTQVWGEEKRLLDKLKTSEFPLVHIEEVQAETRIARSPIEDWYRITISCKSNAGRNDVHRQETNLGECREILKDLQLWLVEEADRDNIHLDNDSTIYQSVEVDEPTNNWGWTIEVNIGCNSAKQCSPRHDDNTSYFSTRVLGLSYSGTPGILSIDIDGTEFGQSWNIENEDKAAILEKIAKTINDDVGSTVIAKTDEAHLYLVAKLANTSPVISFPASNTHTWDTTIQSEFL